MTSNAHYVITVNKPNNTEIHSYANLFEYHQGYQTFLLDSQYTLISINHTAGQVHAVFNFHPAPPTPTPTPMTEEDMNPSFKIIIHHAETTSTLLFNTSTSYHLKVDELKSSEHYKFIHEQEIDDSYVSEFQGKKPITLQLIN